MHSGFVSEWRTIERTSAQHPEYFKDQLEGGEEGAPARCSSSSSLVEELICAPKLDAPIKGIGLGTKPYLRKVLSKYTPSVVSIAEVSDNEQL